MSKLKEVKKELGKYIHNSTEIDNIKMPKKIGFILNEYLYPSYANTPGGSISKESLLLSINIKIAQSLILHRLRVKHQSEEGEIETLINLYGMNFMSSGSGKDKPLKKIHKEFMVKYDLMFTDNLENYKKKIEYEIIEEASKKYEKSKAQRETFIHNNRPRILLKQFKDGTSEGLNELRLSYSKAGWGGTFLLISEFADYITNITQSRGDLISHIVEIFDDGSSSGKVIKSDKDTVPIKSIPCNMLLHTSTEKLFEGKNKDLLVGFLGKGLARRCLVCYPDEEKLTNNKYKGLSLKETYIQSKKNINEINKHTPKIQGFFDDSLNNQQNSTYEYTPESDYTLFCYRVYLNLTKISNHKGQAIKAEFKNRWWRVLKLSGLIAAFEHPNEKEVTKQDVLYAIYQVELFGNHFKKLYKMEKVVGEEKLFDYLLDKIDKWITTTDISKQEFIPNNLPRGWMQNLMETTTEYAYKQGYELKTEKVGTRNQGKRYQLQKIEKEKPREYKFSICTDYNPKNAKDYNPYEIKFEEFHEVISKKINYTPNQFKDNHRKNDNYTGETDLIILDIDEGWTIKKAKQFLEENNLKALIATTKSHTEKHNKFRIILPLLKRFKGTALEYSIIMKKAHKFFLDKPDKACKDAARFYFGAPGCSHWYIDGELLDLQILDAPEVQKGKKKPRWVNIQQEYKNDKEWSLQNMREYFVKNTSEGNRNNSLRKYFLWLNENGYDAKRETEIVNNSLVDPLPDNEMKIICRS